MDKEMKDMLQNINTTLKHIETILLRMESKMDAKSSEEFYEKHGIPRIVAY